MQQNGPPCLVQTQFANQDGEKRERGGWASILLYFFELRLEEREAWLAFLWAEGRLALL